MLKGTVVAALGFLLFALWGGVRVVSDIGFVQDCEGYLKRAADANTVELAAVELAKAVEYAKNNNLTSGFTSVMYRTPDEDVGFWYRNLAQSLEELQKVKPDTAQLERTNVLMKLRETLMDTEGGHMSVTVPPGLSVYPQNVGLAWLGWVSAFMAVFGLFLATVGDYY